jgi:L-ascorbate metabolism protein UlaG (beta-lactamase superfamily)
MAPALEITWLGHAAFLITLPNGKRLLTDPWITNPMCPRPFSRTESLLPLDVILLSHGHDDHVGEVVQIARASGAHVVCVHELSLYLADKGLKNARGMGVGGTQDVNGVAITLTAAIHSGSIREGNQTIYLGGATGFVVRAPGSPTFYFAGDTAIFGDMKIIGEIYRPEIAFLPIGDHYTMGPDTAAVAARWLGARHVVPMHWGTFPLLHGTPDQLRTQLSGSSVSVVDIAPGQTVRV